MKLAEAQVLHIGSMVVYQSQGYSVKNITGVSGKFPTLELEGNGKILKVSARFVGTPARLADGTSTENLAGDGVARGWPLGPEFVPSSGFPTSILGEFSKVEQRFKQNIDRRSELLASRGRIDEEIKRIDFFLEAVTGKLQSISEGLGLTSPTSPVEERVVPETELRLRLLRRRFAGKDLYTCVEQLLTDHPNGLSIGYLARRINHGGYKGRKATTLARTRQSLASMLHGDCHSQRPTFKNVSRGMYALAKRKLVKER